MSRKEEWKVGDRVQKSNWDSTTKVESFTVGAIASLVTETRERPSYSYSRFARTETETYVSKVVVKWDNGEEETLEPYNVHPEDNEFEREFRTKAPEIATQIHEKLALAGKYLDEAEAIANEHGIPFSSSISPLSQSYMTPTFREKWPEVSKEVMQEVTDTYAEYDEYYGWQHSAVCY